MEFLVLLARRVETRAVIEELREGVSEHFEDSDNNKGHYDPLVDFFPDVRLDDLAEAKTEDEHDNGNDDRRPKHEALAKSLDIHSYFFYNSGPAVNAVEVAD